MPRWSDLAKWVGPTKNSGDGDGNEHETADRMTGHDGVVLHIAAGYYQGTIAWQKNPAAEVSSHFIVGKTAADGTVQMVDTDDRSWAQRDGNSRWMSIEFAGWVGEKLTAYQLEQAARILAKEHQVYGVPLQVTNNPKTHGLGHHSMGAENGLNWGHSACPGEPIKAQKAAIVARAKQMLAPTPPAPVKRKVHKMFPMLFLMKGDTTVWLSEMTPAGRVRVPLSSPAQRDALIEAGATTPMPVKDEAELTYLGGPARVTS